MRIFRNLIIWGLFVAFTKYITNDLGYNISNLDILIQGTGLWFFFATMYAFSVGSEVIGYQPYCGYGGRAPRK